MNVIPAALIPADAQWARTGAPAAQALDALVVGVRPECARIAADGIPATIATIEYLGADTLIETRLADQSFIVRLGGRAPATVGDKVGIRWEPAAAHWFDQSSQRRIDQ
jgi:ABC-type sugar transport system ATPase subunit